MMTEDLRTFSEIGRALWADWDRSKQISIDTLSAVALRDLTPTQILEHGTSALLTRVEAEGPAANTRSNLNVIEQAFFRLSAQERIVLVGLHGGGWSYARLGRILGISEEAVQVLVWKARVQLSTDLPRSLKIPYPSGNKLTESRCPEYDVMKPWTQRFLDEEWTHGSEKLYFQKHLLACDPCREALGFCRAVYYAVEAAIPRIDPGFSWENDLRRVLRKSELIRSPISITLKEALFSFSKTLEFRLVTLLLALWVFSLVLHAVWHSVWH